MSGSSSVDSSTQGRESALDTKCLLRAPENHIPPLGFKAWCSFLNENTRIGVDREIFSPFPLDLIDQEDFKKGEVGVERRKQHLQV